ncbi:MAG: hypothetical protein MJZ55_03610 [Paludibacteraceae bacterium]|nr:hypothetical protein [Paludibacteraceae bacterium]
MSNKDLLFVLMFIVLSICIPTNAQHAYVDLGLSVKWATCNIGADNPENHGDFFSWGETENKKNNNWDTYKYSEGTPKALLKYCSNPDFAWHQITDSISSLEPDDDVAHVKWGGNWHIPTRAQIDELLDNCTWTWITQNGVNGYKVTSNKVGYTNKSIFIPVTGEYEDGKLFNYRTHGYYWSKECGTVTSETAYTLEVYTKGASREIQPRYKSLAVRPVCP